jgi:hypothetical protein
MATSIDMVLNLRSAREWSTVLEDADPSAHWKNSAAAEECAQRLERIITAARLDGLTAKAKSRRAIISPLRDDLAMQEAQIGRAIQFLQRRQSSGAVVENEWRVLTSHAKTIEESMAES